MSPKQINNSGLSANAVPTFVPGVVPIIISPHGIEKWLHRYGSEAPEPVFRAAMAAWESARLLDDVGFHQCEVLRELHYRDMRAFTRAIGLST